MNITYTIPIIETSAGDWQIEKILPLDAFVYSSFLRNVFSNNIVSTSTIKMMLLNESALFNPLDTNISSLNSYEINDSDYIQGGNTCSLLLSVDDNKCTFLINVNTWQNSTLSFWKSIIYNSDSGELVLFVDFLEKKELFSNDFDFSGKIDIKI